MSVLLSTSIGNIVADLDLEETPDLCKNFLHLYNSHYYNNVLIFSIEKNFICRTGDPTGTGKGGSAYGPDRFKPVDKNLRHHKGSIGFLPDGEGNVGSAFYITLGDNLDYLDGKYVFAEVQEGFDVIDKINDVVCDKNYRPFNKNFLFRILSDSSNTFDPSLDSRIQVWIYWIQVWM